MPSNREAVILAILVNGDKYGRQIRDEYEKRTNQTLPLGSLYTTLMRMEDAGFIKARDGEPIANRGGNRPRYFSITGLGQRSLNSFEIFVSAVKGITRYAV
jgi:PadR family transcriptional regulator, regulatory protein PadR